MLIDVSRRWSYTFVSVTPRLAIWSNRFGHTVQIIIIIVLFMYVILSLSNSNHFNVFTCAACAWIILVMFYNAKDGSRNYVIIIWWWTCRTTSQQHYNPAAKWLVSFSDLMLPNYILLVSVYEMHANYCVNSTHKTCSTFKTVCWSSSNLNGFGTSKLFYRCLACQF